ncbi:hypothetical protein B0H14DRAFT_3477816 [Mycena olivaceomarginata]|nr:hypothetical protein B0H14DRAFT_3477816 [Mycena olivaceomarginata]
MSPSAVRPVPAIGCVIRVQRGKETEYMKRLVIKPILRRICTDRFFQRFDIVTASGPEKITVVVVENVDQVLEPKTTPEGEIGKGHDVLGYSPNTRLEFGQRILLEDNRGHGLEKICRHWRRDIIAFLYILKCVTWHFRTLSIPAQSHRHFLRRTEATKLLEWSLRVFKALKRVSEFANLLNTSDEQAATSDVAMAVLDSVDGIPRKLSSAQVASADGEGCFSNPPAASIEKGPIGPLIGYPEDLEIADSVNRSPIAVIKGKGCDRCLMEPFPCLALSVNGRAVDERCILCRESGTECTPVGASVSWTDTADTVAPRNRPAMHHERLNACPDHVELELPLNSPRFWLRGELHRVLEQWR